MSAITRTSMARRRIATATIAAALLSLPTAAAAQPPDRIELPPGWMPEGITGDWITRLETTRPDVE